MNDLDAKLNLHYSKASLWQFNLIRFCLFHFSLRYLCFVLWPLLCEVLASCYGQPHCLCRGVNGISQPHGQHQEQVLESKYHTHNIPDGEMISEKKMSLGGRSFVTISERFWTCPTPLTCHCQMPSSGPLRCLHHESKAMAATASAALKRTPGWNSWWEWPPSPSLASHQTTPQYHAL